VKSSLPLRKPGVHAYRLKFGENQNNGIEIFF